MTQPQAFKKSLNKKKVRLPFAFLGFFLAWEGALILAVNSIKPIVIGSMFFIGSICIVMVSRDVYIMIKGI